MNCSAETILKDFENDLINQTIYEIKHWEEKRAKLKTFNNKGEKMKEFKIGQVIKIGDNVGVIKNISNIKNSIDKKIYEIKTVTEDGIKIDFYSYDEIEFIDFDEMDKKRKEAIKNIPIRDYNKILSALKGKEPWISIPGDKIVIKHSKGVISDSISLQLVNKNRNEIVYFAIPNKIKSWEWLKELNNIGGRSVTYQTNDENEIPYSECLPYKVRFK